MTNRTTFLTDETNRRVYWGGSWSFDPQSARVALRNYVIPDYRYSRLGVRFVEVIEDTK